VKKVYDWFGGRKYFFAQEIFLISLILRFCNKINEDNFVTISLWSLGLFAGISVVQKIGRFDKKGEQ
jgi:hypothetical protein